MADGSRSSRTLLRLALFGAIFTGAALYVRARPAAPPPGPGADAPVRVKPTSPTVPPSPAPPVFVASAPTAVDALARALAAGNEEGTRAAAAALRRLLRGDPAARDAAARTLLDPASDPVLRQALALVFGTFGGAENDRVLRALLGQTPADPALVRCALLALGGTREPEEDDDVFGLGDRPWGANGPGGLGITVRRGIEDAATRGDVEGFLGGAAPPVREAAARALRHTVNAADVRDAFLGRLSTEPVDEVAEVLGETLAGRAGRTEDAADRRAILGALLARAGEDGLDGYRFRMEDDFQRIPLDAAASRDLRGLAAAGRPFAVRSFALSALAGSAARGAVEEQAPVRALLVGLLGSDPDAAVRDLAARLLHRLQADAGSVAVLAAAARGDAAWNVRFTALETLAGCGPLPGVAEALDAAMADPDARVAARAKELRAKSSPK